MKLSQFDKKNSENASLTDITYWTPCIINLNKACILAGILLIFQVISKIDFW